VGQIPLSDGDRAALQALVPLNVPMVELLSQL
jgi:hypothetical protein